MKRCKIYLVIIAKIVTSLNSIGCSLPIALQEGKVIFGNDLDISYCSKNHFSLPETHHIATKTFFLPKASHIATKTFLPKNIGLLYCNRNIFLSKDQSYFKEIIITFP